MGLPLQGGKLEIIRISTGRVTRPLQTFSIDTVGDGFPVPKIRLVKFRFFRLLAKAHKHASD